MKSCTESSSPAAIAYDVVCPSDYMVQRMIENDLLAEINYENVPNLNILMIFIWKCQNNMTRKTNTPFRIFGERSEYFITRKWWTNL
mgnify:CR=1 FL=1